MKSKRVMLITGTRKGLGRYLAEHYLRQGWLVEGCSREAPDWRRKGYAHHAADVTDEAAVRRMMASIRERHGRLDALINNAGIAAMNHVLLTPLATAERIMRTNFLGSFLLARESVKLMRARGAGRIVNIGTVATPLLLEGEALYAASKAALENFTRILAREVAPFGITCNLVGPTPMDTDLIRNVPPAKIRAIVNRLAIKRLGRPADVANATDFFLRPASDYLTGQIIYLGGA